MTQQVNESQLRDSIKNNQLAINIIQSIQAAQQSQLNKIQTTLNFHGAILEQITKSLAEINSRLASIPPQNTKPDPNPFHTNTASEDPKLISQSSDLNPLQPPETELFSDQEISYPALIDVTNPMAMWPSTAILGQPATTLLSLGNTHNYLHPRIATFLVLEIAKSTTISFTVRNLKSKGLSPNNYILFLMGLMECKAMAGKSKPLIFDPGGSDTFDVRDVFQIWPKYDYACDNVVEWPYRKMILSTKCSRKNALEIYEWSGISNSSWNLILAKDSSTSYLIKGTAVECGIDFSEYSNAIVIDHIAYVVTLITYLGLWWFDIVDPTPVYDQLEEIYLALVGSLVFCVFLLYKKGLVVPPSTYDGSSGNMIIDFYRELELSPRASKRKGGRWTRIKAQE